MTVIALVGRPNVGKSSIFNKLVGKQMAIVHDTPGVTRDYRLADAELGHLKFKIMDTAGLEQDVQGDVMFQQMQDKTMQAVRQADILLFVINGQEGINPVDEAMARQIRQWNKPIILLVNKADDRKAKNTALEAYSLGLGEPMPVSAAHNQGFLDLQDALVELMPEQAEEEEEEDAYDNFEFGDEVTEEEAAMEEDPTKPIKIAIVGRPNVGKSTLLNAIIGEERAITSPVAGTTRDPVTVQWLYNDRPFRLVDTAGLRKRYKIIDRIEKMSAAETERAIRLAQVVILVIDVAEALDHQDQAIADHVIREGRALIIAVNKWDTAQNPDTLRKELRERLDFSIAQVKDVPLVTLSAINGKGVTKLQDAVLDIYRVWQKRVATSPLNRWLEQMEVGHQPPMASGRSNRLRYMTQIKSKPPTFALWVSRPDDLPDSYQRYLVNGLRETFKLPGVPIRLSLRKSKNPYAEGQGKD
ncbi:MAG: ribosome biosis GTPase Der [Alphaproteobacteria bacterium]|nr:ribosome biosis GTPase Der [Alphaproteobacteria bacterium]